MHRTLQTLMAGTAVGLLAAGAAMAQSHGDFTVGEGEFTWDSYQEFADSTDLSGETLTISGPWTGDEKAKVDIVMAFFEDATGASVEYSGSDNFEQDIIIAARAGSAPNLAVFPQPGLAADMASQGLLTPLEDGTAEWVAENFAAGDSWVDLGTYADESGEDQLYGFFYRIDLKSLVWYSPAAFDEMGYDIPETMEDLKALTEQIVEDGETPWCIGLGSGAATGWPATDWVEDMMLRVNSPEDYDAWVTNELPFDDPKVVAAIEEFGWFATNDDFVSGGAQSVANTDFRDSPSGLFEIPPGCYMHRQASFIPAFFPEGTVVGEDVDFFYFPAYEDQDLRPAGPRRGHALRDHRPVGCRNGNDRVPEAAGRARIVDGAGRVPHGACRRESRDICRRKPSRAGRDPLGSDDLPVRRLRPDAGRDRCRGVLDRHGGLRHRC